MRTDRRARARGARGALLGSALALVAVAAAPGPAAGAPATGRPAAAPATGTPAAEAQAAGARAADGETTLISVGLGGKPADGPSERASISADGRLVVFTSHADNLVRGDRNGCTDVFLRDVARGRTVRVDRGYNGRESNGCTGIDPIISADGRYAVYSADSTNLVRGVRDGRSHIYRTDLRTGETVLVSAAKDGTPGDGDSMRPTLSADGRYVAFATAADNLVPGDTPAGTWDTVVRDMATGTVVRTSAASDGTAGNAASDGTQISADGRYVTFFSNATDLVEGDTNKKVDEFLHDTVTGRTTRLSVTAAGIQSDQITIGGTISDDNRYVVLNSHATNLTADSPDTTQDHAYLQDLTTGALRLIDKGADGVPAPGGTFWASITGDGLHIPMSSSGPHLVDGDTNGVRDIFVADLPGGALRRVSVGSGGQQADAASYFPDADQHAEAVVFTSYATNLVPGDTNGQPDIFLHREKP
ncbi:TolB family protein [Streptomyces anandii]|uniref:TolB family protein n=1 Tax=Streptomyces anandii TaxID=285454 RepID=UPI0036F7D9D7